MSNKFPHPARTGQYYYPDVGVDTAYGFYAFVDDDEFLVHLKGLYPKLEWEHHETGSEWAAKHGEHSISRFERVSMTNAFHTNSTEVQWEEVYDFVRVILDGWSDCYNGRTVVWLSNLDVSALLNVDSMTYKSTLNLTLAVAYYYPESEQ